MSRPHGPSSSRLGERLSSLESTLTTFIRESRRRDEETDSRIDKLVATLEERSRTPWRLVLGFLAFAITVVGLAAQPFLSDVAQVQDTLSDHRERLHQHDLELLRLGLQGPSGLADARLTGIQEEPVGPPDPDALEDFDPAVTDAAALVWANHLLLEARMDIGFGVPVGVVIGGNPPGTLGATYNLGPGGFLIRLQSGMGRQLLFTVLAHELGHVLAPDWTADGGGHGDAWGIEQARVVRALLDLGEFAPAGR